MIPVFSPQIDEEEIQAVVGALRRGEISGSFGDTIPEFEEKCAKSVGCRYGVAVTSGTTALHLAVAAARIGPGDEVLVSASTNIATALCVYHHQAVAVPVDSESVTWNLDLDLIESLVTPRTRAIIPVHLFGHPVDMDRLVKIARKHKLMIIEDCAESQGATCRGRQTGSFGELACFSFYANKLITTGEGGMVMTNDRALAERVRLLRNLAFTTPRFLHQEAGYNFRMTGIQAAMGIAQLGKLERFIEQKRRLAHRYNQALSGVPGLQLPPELEWARNVYWMYALTVDESEFGISRDQLMQELKTKGIETRTFFCPMNLQPFLQRQKGFRPVKCPVAERIWTEGLYLPSSVLLTDAEIEQVATAIRSCAHAPRAKRVANL